MPCPYFFPLTQTSRKGDAAPHWPLLASWEGACHAEPAMQHLATEQLHGCNFGYAATCPRLPTDRAADRSSFQVVRRRDDGLQVAFSLERDHRPVAHGTLLYDLGTATWRVSHPDPILQRQAECYRSEYVACSPVP